MKIDLIIRQLQELREAHNKATQDIITKLEKEAEQDNINRIARRNKFKKLNN